MRRRGIKAAFTLLEVMVAIAILALSLSAIFASEAGAIKMAHRSRKMGMATLLARCKMGEIEEQVAVEGLPAIDDSGSDACCEGAEIDGFRCDWEIAPIVLPDNMFAPPEGEGAEGEAAEGAGDPATQMKEQLSSLDPTQVLSGGADIGGLTSMAMSYVFPILKPSFEQQIRRATVTVRWREGSTDHSFDVTQYMVSDQPISSEVTDPNAQPGQGGEQSGGQLPGGTPLSPGAPGGR